MWKTRPWGVVSTKRDVTPDGSWRGGRVVGSVELDKESWCVYAMVSLRGVGTYQVTWMSLMGEGEGVDRDGE